MRAGCHRATRDGRSRSEQAPRPAPAAHRPERGRPARGSRRPTRWRLRFISCRSSAWQIRTSSFWYAANPSSRYVSEAMLFLANRPRRFDTRNVRSRNLRIRSAPPVSAGQGARSRGTGAQHFSLHRRRPLLLEVRTFLRLSRQSTRAKSFSTETGTETTLGCPQAVEMRIVRDMNCMLVVNKLLTTATTRPVQSNTGAPEAP